MSDETIMYRIGAEVVKERLRQNVMYGEQNLDNGQFLAVLMEEVGEVAQALQEGSREHKPTDASDLYEELIQVAAVAQKWAEKVLKESQEKHAL